MKLRFLACFFLFISVTAATVQKKAPLIPVASNKNEERIKVSYCELKKDPAAYNHKLIEVTGFISHGFEDFTLFEPTCSSYPEVWLEYGGTAVSGTMYCCGVTSARSRPKPLVIEKIPVELLADERFKELDKLIRRPPDSIVRATVLGRFFAGEHVTYPSGRSAWAGFGHMGCCSLLAIQQVVSVEPQNSTELDYRATADQPGSDEVGCGYTFLTEIDTHADSLKAQAQADLGQPDWAFTDPTRVATDELARLIKVGSSSIKLRQTRKAQGRFIYEWRPRGKKVTYMVVVSRPYWLSFYAKDPNRVAWIVAGAYEVGCGPSNSVQRIK